ncbi:universal stress protein [Photobacterium makurazakiensis]|uniref:universal stress protein n=1 Tax=Photobacterium makurazakiensis TaxID=2910234 RepID=UPI003D151AAA
MTKIIACLDGSSLSSAVEDTACWAAQSLNAPLAFLHVIDQPDQATSSELSGQIGLGSREQLLNQLVILDEQRNKLAVKHGKLLLEDAQKKALQLGLFDPQRLLLHGSLLSTLDELADELRLLVIGKSGSEHQNMQHTIGSQLESVVRSVQAHILVATNCFTVPAEYLLAYDGSAIGQKLIEKAIRTPLLKGMTCHLVTVDKHASEGFVQASQKLQAAGIDVIEQVLQGEVHSALLNYQQQKQIELIVMGAYGHSQWRQFFVGSNTTKIMADSEAALLLIR